MKPSRRSERSRSDQQTPSSKKHALKQSLVAPSSRKRARFSSAVQQRMAAIFESPEEFMERRRKEILEEPSPGPEVWPPPMSKKDRLLVLEEAHAQAMEDAEEDEKKEEEEEHLRREQLAGCDDDDATTESEEEDLDKTPRAAAIHSSPPPSPSVMNAYNQGLAEGGTSQFLPPPSAQRRSRGPSPERPATAASRSSEDLPEMTPPRLDPRKKVSFEVAWKVVVEEKKIESWRNEDLVGDVALSAVNEKVQALIDEVGEEEGLALRVRKKLVSASHSKTKNNREAFNQTWLKDAHFEALIDRLIKWQKDGLTGFKVGVFITAAVREPAPISQSAAIAPVAS